MKKGHDVEEKGIVIEPEPEELLVGDPYQSKHKLGRHTIKYDGIFDWQALYRIVWNWFVDRGYYVEEPTIKHKVPNPMGSNDEYNLVGWRRITDYAREWVEVYFEFYEMKDVEVIKEGKKKKLTKARFRLDITGWIETDWEGRWKKTNLTVWVNNWMQKVMLKRDLDVIWTDRLYYIMYKLHTIIRNYLDMQAKDNAYYDMW